MGNPWESGAPPPDPPGDSSDNSRHSQPPTDGPADSESTVSEPPVPDRVVDGPGVRAGRATIPELPGEIPAMTANAAGLAAMLVAGKGGRKQPSMKTLRVYSVRNLIQFRDDRQKCEM